MEYLWRDGDLVQEDEIGYLDVKVLYYDDSFPFSV